MKTDTSRKVALTPPPVSEQVAVPLPELFLHPSRIHGQDHVARVQILGRAVLALHPHLKHLELPLWASVYLHDLARTHDGRCTRHGGKAVARYARLPYVRSVFQGYGMDLQEHPEIKTAVTYHSLSEELARTHDHWPLTALLKDADGLDRVRIGDLDPSYLRLPESRRLVRFSEKLFEATAKRFLHGPDYFAQIWPRAQAIWDEVMG